MIGRTIIFCARAAIVAAWASVTPATAAEITKDGDIVRIDGTITGRR